MATKFLHSQGALWSEITTRVKKAKRNYVAVAYLGTDATRLLPLKRGDVLVTDMSLPAIKAGQTNPSVVQTFVDHGVEVFSCGNLHAKVFVCGKTTIVGSTNVSKNSKDCLLEAAVLSDEPSVMFGARGFVKSLAGERVTPGYIKTCKKEYRAPKWGPGRNAGNGNRGKKKSPKPAHPRLWILRVYPADYTDQENDIHDRGVARATKALPNRRKYDVSSMRWNSDRHFAQEVRLGDQVIQIREDDDGELRVYPPSRVVLIRHYKSSNYRRAPRMLVFFEEPIDAELVGWKDLNAVLRKAGVSRVGKNISREIRDEDTKHKLLGLWK